LKEIPFLCLTQIAIKLYHGSNESKKSIITVLTDLIKVRWDPASKFLNLENILSDPEFAKLESLGFQQDSRKGKFGLVLCKMIQEQCPDMQTLSLARNKIKHLGHLATLHERTPNLINLSLEGNDLASLSSLEPIKGKMFPKLRELILSGNPIVLKEIARSSEFEYKKNIKLLFPSIQMLDFQEVPAGLDVNPLFTGYPFPISTGFMDSEVTANTTAAFLTSYFSLFDTNRSALSNYYHDNASFTLSVNKAKVTKGQTTVNNFDGFYKFNHNLDTIKSTQARQNTMYTGPTQIMNAIVSLPEMTHPLDGQSTDFLVEAYQMGAGDDLSLYIQVHGYFTVKTLGKRSFDRIFVLKPAHAGSRSANASLPVTIMNDMLAISNYRGNAAWANLPTVKQNPLDQFRQHLVYTPNAEPSPT
jgi:nuclear RNA export factor